MPQMTIHFAQTSAQQAELDHLLVEVQDRRSPQFHKFLNPEQYADRFGVNAADIAEVVRWLEKSGFSNIEPARSKASINFTGTAEGLQRLSTLPFTTT